MYIQNKNVYKIIDKNSCFPVSILTCTDCFVLYFLFILFVILMTANCNSSVIFPISFFNSKINFSHYHLICMYMYIHMYNFIQYTYILYICLCTYKHTYRILKYIVRLSWQKSYILYNFWFSRAKSSTLHIVGTQRIAFQL